MSSSVAECMFDVYTNQLEENRQSEALFSADREVQNYGR